MGYYDDYYRALVRDVVALTPNMIRIVLGGGDLRRFAGSGDPDERLVVAPPRVGEHEPAGPIRQDDGSLDFADEDQPVRSYTVRRFDPAGPELVIDVVRHAGGAVAGWASGAVIGDVVYLSPARGWYDPPAGTAWQLLLADMTGLPALARIVEELPAGQRAIVLAEVPADGDRGYADAGYGRSRAGVDWHWLVGSGNGLGPSRLLAALRGLELPTDPGYLWFAGEATESRAVRKHLRRDLGWPSRRSTVIGYWRANDQAWLARYRQVGDALEQTYADALASGLSEGEALAVYDEALERAGL